MDRFKLSRDELSQLPLERLTPWLREIGYFLRSPGAEHYRLLAYLSTWMEGRLLFDIGTGGGHSALALSWNPSNQVISFDVVNGRALMNEARLPNVEFRIEDVTAHPQLLEAGLVFLDASPHYGVFEKKVYDQLVAGNYRGLLVLDDIGSPLFPDMSRFWDTIDVPKFDVTAYGHHSGTGLVNFGGLAIELA